MSSFIESAISEYERLSAERVKITEKMNKLMDIVLSDTGFPLPGTEIDAQLFLVIGVPENSMDGLQSDEDVPLFMNQAIFRARDESEASEQFLKAYPGNQVVNISSYAAMKELTQQFEEFKNSI